MSVIKEILKQMNDDIGDSIYLREIALLMEENDSLRETTSKLEKDLKSCKFEYIKLQNASAKKIVMVNKLRKELRNRGKSE